MSKKTLYFLQSNLNSTPHLLQKVDQIFDQDDAVVFMGESVLYLENNWHHHKANVYMLENDAELFANTPPEHVKILNYADFAELVLTFNRCISLK